MENGQKVEFIMSGFKYKGVIYNSYSDKSRSLTHYAVKCYQNIELDDIEIQGPIYLIIPVDRVKPVG